MNYKEVATGLLYASVSSNSLELIYVLSRRYTSHPDTSWEGVIYTYFNFSDMKVYEFNEYWEGFINNLQPVTDAKITQAARSVMKKHFDKELSGLNEVANFAAALQLTV